jgi:hypothetical protein
MGHGGARRFANTQVRLRRHTTFRLLASRLLAPTGARLPPACPKPCTSPRVRSTRGELRLESHWWPRPPLRGACIRAGCAPHPRIASNRERCEPSRNETIGARQPIRSRASRVTTSFGTRRAARRRPAASTRPRRRSPRHSRHHLRIGGSTSARSTSPATPGRRCTLVRSASASAMGMRRA